MRAKPFIAGIAAAGLALVGAGVGGTGAGASTSYAFLGYAGGSQIKALDETVTSSLSADSSVYGGEAAQTSSNVLAGASAQGVLTLGAISTSSQIAPVTGGWALTSVAHAADVSLLGGLITATAVDTTATVSVVNDAVQATSSSKFVGIKIAGVHVPVDIPENFTVKIPGVATVTINAVFAAAQGGQGAAVGAGISITLLQKEGSADAGATVYVTPVFDVAALITEPDTGHANLGKAYGTSVTAHVGTLVGVRSDPTAVVDVYHGGTDGKTVTNSIAATNLSPLLHVGAVTDTGFGTNTTAKATTSMTSKVTGLNLFNGLITASAVSVAATASSDGTQHASMSLLNLTIAGKAIPVTVSPNTTIKVAGLGTVVLNQRIPVPGGISVRGIDIVLNTAAYGLPAGAEVQIAAAGAAAS